MFTNREEAALKLAQKLSLRLHSVAQGRRLHDILVLGIPRGGVVTAYAVAKTLKVPLDVIVTRKIGAPNQPELAIGAVGPEGVVILDNKLIEELGVEDKWLKKEIRAQRLEVSRRMKKFRVGLSDLKLTAKRQASLILKLKTVVLVDDGIATGATVEAGIKYLTLRQAQGGGPKKIILAVPVAPKDTAERFRNLVDKVIVLETPPNFYAVGQFYQDFPQVTDEEVVQLLQK